MDQTPSAPEQTNTLLITAKQDASLTAQDNTLTHYFALFWGWGYFWGI